MVIIYDFDGTLTPYSLPQYEIIKKCGYNEEMLMNRIEEKLTNSKSLYEAYYKCYIEILLENNILLTKANVCLGADKVEFNNGVIEYFKNFQSQTTGVKHYIVTSGIKDYVDKTVIRKLVDGVYGVTFNEENGIYKDIDMLLTDKKKVDFIKQVQKDNQETNNIIYFGDGLTDGFAFEYVHSIGGKNVFIATKKESMETYKQLNVKGIIDKYFEPDFSMSSKLSKYIQTQIGEEKCK
ncbi:MAG: hypothetical protein ACLTTR_04785 [Clostridia bacterium]|jgi:phosphoserine phosphatase|nr:hypothetical protein [Clostridium sp.]MEE0269383.1 hypothetical protein [Clostridia bacterium]